MFSYIKEEVITNPYIRLIRLHKPIGIILLLMPCLWSLGLAAPANKFPFGYFILFTIGAIITRSLGCIINDIIDRKYDAKIERTKDRPLAAKEISLFSAVILLLILSITSMMTLLLLPTEAISLGYIIILPIILYPFAKRFTNWPQAILAITFNWGVLIAWASVQQQLNIFAFILYLGSCFWTLGYDTIYAHQDKKGDSQLGLKSTALFLGENSKKFICIFYLFTIIALWILGVVQNIGVAYHIFLLIAMVILFWQVKTLNINDPEDCRRKFSSNGIFGFVILLGVLTKFI